MHYYKDAVPNVYAYTYASSVREGLIPISEEEALAIAAGPASEANVIEQERMWRDNELSSVIWLRDRHRDQLDLGAETTLTPEQFTGLLMYMQELRDWPQSANFPDSQRRPTAPGWIAEQVQ